MFDPRGSVLAAPSTCTPAAKMFSLTGNYSQIIPPFKLLMLYDAPHILGLSVFVLSNLYDQISAIILSLEVDEQCFN